MQKVFGHLFIFILLGSLLGAVFEYSTNTEAYLNGIVQHVGHKKDYDRDGETDSARASQVNLVKTIKLTMIPMEVALPILVSIPKLTKVAFVELIQHKTAKFSFTIFRPPIA